MASYSPIGKAMFQTVGSFNYLDLLSDGDDVVSRAATLVTAAGIQKRGAILKLDPATLLVSIPAAATDCNCILVDDTDASGGNAACGVYVGGKFKADAVIWPGALSHSLVTDNLRNFDIQIESVIYTDGSTVKSAPAAAEEAEAKKLVEENRKRAKEAAKPAEPEEAKVPPRDGPMAYLTPEEREKHPEYAEIHDRADEEKEEKDASVEKKPPASATTSHTPPKKSSGD